MASAPADIPARLRLTPTELTGFFTQSWQATTAILPFAATRTLRTLDMVDLSVFGQPLQTPVRDLCVGVTAPLGLSEHGINALVRQAMVTMAEDFGFPEADISRL
jgi:hypothetical protein